MRITQNNTGRLIGVFEVDRSKALDVLGKYLSTRTHPAQYETFCRELRVDKSFFLEVLQRGLAEFGVTPTHYSRDDLGLDYQTWQDILKAIKAHMK